MDSSQKEGVQKDRYRERVEGLLESLGLMGHSHHYPHELSGGQQQRVSLARALVHEPDLIIADEPTGNLDVQTEAKILDIFADLHAKGSSIMVVTHQRRVAEHSQQVYQVEDEGYLIHKKFGG